MKNHEKMHTHQTGNKIHIQHDINHSTEYTRHSKCAHVQATETYLHAAQYGMCVAINRYTWHNSSITMTTVENAYIYRYIYVPGTL